MARLNRRGIAPRRPAWIDPSKAHALAAVIPEPPTRELVCLRLEPESLPCVCWLGMPDGSPFLDGRLEIPVGVNWVMPEGPTP